MKRNTANPVVKTEERLSVAIFQAIFECSADGLVLLDASRRVVYVNAAAKRMLGRESLAGCFCGHLFQCHDPANIPMYEQNCVGQCALTAKQPMTNVEMNIQTKDGRTLPVSVTYSPIEVNDADSYLLMSIRDLSVQKRLQQEQMRNQELHYTLQERERIARDIHDGVAQDIAYVNLQIKLMLDDVRRGEAVDAAQLENLSRVLDNSLVDLRQAIYDLTFRVTGHFVPYLQRYVLEFGNRHHIHTEFHHRGDDITVPPYVANQVVKAMQEALNNVRKHASATHVVVHLETTPATAKPSLLRLVIQDDGVGFSTAEKATSDHYGLRTMRERCELIGGRLSIDSAPGQGTRVTLTIPLH
ncbi:hypothetical protein GCM10025857_25270 [Alicyclobacillus contaminans]|uniref:sensor histidine kinase n=1 Tax=Alicyclobacillus contaminans TaxID=392016 RepID=UPI0004190E9B|nr:PAS domain-containing sensor histidine kinase [Alicyclobacillus contaminans]GMA51170.1 hypothetical protein GCM10025857_25270 [Alicyclobacillus contaminans]